MGESGSIIMLPISINSATTFCQNFRGDVKPGCPPSESEHCSLSSGYVCNGIMGRAMDDSCRALYIDWESKGC